jgi:ankyrin repeat protein
VRLLIREGAHTGAHAVTDSGERALHCAARGGSFKVIDYLVKVRQFAVNQRDNDFVTPLMCAVAAGRADAVACLFNLGADAALSDSNGATARDRAEGIEDAHVRAAVLDALGGRRVRTRDLCKEELEKLRTDAGGDNGPTCAICMEDFAVEDFSSAGLEELTATDCATHFGAHIFHTACLTPWVKLKSSCPSCRRVITNQLLPGEKIEG